jgi:hypothetical protein
MEFNLEKLKKRQGSEIKKGQVVRSAMRTNGTVFKVTAIEEETNTFICKSVNAASGDRARYAYKKHELIPLGECVTFTHGKKYKLDNEHIVICSVRDCTDDDFVENYVIMLVYLNGALAGNNIVITGHSVFFTGAELAGQVSFTSIEAL